jgi:cytochrome P450
MRDLRDGPDIVESAADELLRCETPIQISVPQLVADDIEVGGRHLERGDLVHFVLGAANRDPARFPDPDRLDLRRPPRRHIGFGVGLHNCLGASLARLEGQEVLPHLVRRFPNLRLNPDAQPPAFQPVPHVRSLARLPLVLNGTDHQ